MTETRQVIPLPPEREAELRDALASSEVTLRQTVAALRNAVSKYAEDSFALRLALEDAGRATGDSKGLSYVIAEVEAEWLAISTGPRASVEIHLAFPLPKRDGWNG